MKAQRWILAGLLLGLGGSVGVADGSPTYYGEVAPILNANCVGCHTEGGIAPFPLDSAEWAVKMAPAIASAVSEGRMPPWPPGETSPKMRGERRLSPEAIATLVSWAKAGAPLGEGKRSAFTPSGSVARMPDLVAFRISLNPGTPAEKILLDIPRWDFHWQGEYWFAEPIALRQGDRVRISCVYDNAEAIPGPDGRPLEPRYLTWGEGTTDEMCLGGISWVRTQAP